MCGAHVLLTRANVCGNPVKHGVWDRANVCGNPVKHGVWDMREEHKGFYI